MVANSTAAALGQISHAIAIAKAAKDESHIQEAVEK
jgi:hypothetical protein